MALAEGPAAPGARPQLGESLLNALRRPALDPLRFPTRTHVVLADDTVHVFLDDRSSDRLWLTAAPTYKLLANSPPMFWDTRRGRRTLRWRGPRFGLVGDVEPRFRELDAVLGGMVDVLGDVLRLMEDLRSALRSQRLE